MRLSSAGRFVVACVFVMMGMPAASLFAQTVAQGDLGSVSIRVLPPTAEIFIDGERWVSPENSAALVVQLPPGRHAIEIRARGYRVFSTVVDVRRGETTPLNVSLTGGNPPSESTGPAPAPSPETPGPITPSVSENGYAIAPDFRFSELNHQTAGFAGVYGGRVFDRRLLIGAGGYWQTNGTNGVSDMVYGGAVVEWRLWSDRTVGFNLHGLAGYGQVRAEHPFAIDPRIAHDIHDEHQGFHGDGGFFVAEPEFQVVARFASHLSLKGGVGYRVTSLHNDDLGGVSGSISIQFGR